MAQFHWDPAEYAELMRVEVPDYELLQAELVAATRGIDPAAVLELGTGTGVTAAAVLDAHPRASLTGVDSSAGMLAAAERALTGRDATLFQGRLEHDLPGGPWDLVVSALAVHHLDGPGKAALFARVAAALAPGGVFVLADVVVPDDPADAVTPLDPDIDTPSAVGDQLSWLRDAGLEPEVTWSRGDLAVMRARRP